MRCYKQNCLLHRVLDPSATWDVGQGFSLLSRYLTTIDTTIVALIFNMAEISSAKCLNYFPFLQNRRCLLNIHNYCKLLKFKNNIKLLSQWYLASIAFIFHLINTWKKHMWCCCLEATERHTTVLLVNDLTGLTRDGSLFVCISDRMLATC